MDLSIIIVNWNSKDYLRKCLASILAHTRGIQYEILVIDSASFDGCEQMLREEFGSQKPEAGSQKSDLRPPIRFIQSATNLGFARANNTAFRASQGRHVLFLNPDTEIIGPALTVMLERLRSLPDAGSVGCKLLNTDGTVQTSCIQSLPTILNQMLDSEFLRARWPRAGLWGMAALYDPGLRDQPCAVEAISGACVMVKRDVFEQVGGFSEDYFMYAEDVDLSDKISKSGHRNYFVPDATVVHHGGGSSSGAASDFSVVMTREAIWRFFLKTRGRAYGMGYRATVLLAACLRLLCLIGLLPLTWARRELEPWKNSFRKWRAVLRWGVNRASLVKQYQ